LKVCSAEEAAGYLRPIDTLAVPLGPGLPSAFLDALGERDDWRELTVFAALLTHPHRLFTRPGVRLLSGFFGPIERALREAGHDVRFVPGDFRRFARIARSLAPRVMATSVAPPGKDGSVSLSLHAGAMVAELHRCGADRGRLLVVEASPRYPRTLGLPPDHPHALEPGEIDLLVPSDRAPRELPDEAPDPVSIAIAEHAIRFVPEAATLQTGIGAIPSQVVAKLAAGMGGDYGVHSEMFTTGLMQLHVAGKVSNRRKGIFEGFSVATFAMGTHALYDWLDGRDDVRFLPVDVVNDPTTIGRNRRMISLNGALEIDLQGQVVADTIRGVQYSGIGGHEDFVAGAGLGEDDRSLLCLPATTQLGGRRVSRITRQLAAGSVVTTPRHQVDVIVTEYGAAELAGRSVEERAARLVAIAHPDFREELSQ
jgi:acyl-CoA hydrolase